MEETLSGLFTALQELLQEHFRTVRLSMVQNAEQFAQELKALNADKLPGVIIVFDTNIFHPFEGIEETQLTLVLVNSFVAGSSEKAFSLLKETEKLLALFPADGRNIANYHCYPADCVTATPDSRFAALALGITCKK